MDVGVRVERLTGALLDRLTHHVHILEMNGDSYRLATARYPTLTGRRLWREIKERGYAGGYTAVTDLLRELRPPRAKGFEEAPITKSSDRHPARLGNFTSALLGKSKSAFTQR